VAALWVGANWMVMGDPLYFAFSEYSNEGQAAARDATEEAAAVAGDLGATLWFVLERAWPFLIPIGFLLLIRAVEGRLFRANTVSLVLLSTIVQFGLIVPFLYRGASFG
jgi:hypothetical protein